MMNIRRLLVGGALIALCAAIPGCTNADMEAELAQRNARLDELEKQDQAIRNILYGKLNALRGKLLPIIEQVEADLKKRIDNESDKIIYALEERVKAMIEQIDKGFAEAQAYIDGNMQSCYNDINDTFTSLFDCKQALEDGLKLAIKDHNSDLEALLRKYEKQVDGIMGRAENFEATLKKLETRIKGAEEIDVILDDYHSRCLDLQEAYVKMEDQEALLLEAMGKLVSQEYLARLEIDQINELKDLLSTAEGIVDGLEYCKSDIEGALSDSDGILSEMKDVASLAEGDLLSFLEDAVEEGRDLQGVADDLQDYLTSFDADLYLDVVQEALDRLETNFSDVNDLVNYIDDVIAELVESGKDRAHEVSTYYNDAESKFVEALSFYGDLEPYLKF